MQNCKSFHFLCVRFLYFLKIVALCSGRFDFEKNKGSIRTEMCESKRWFSYVAEKLIRHVLKVCQNKGKLSIFNLIPKNINLQRFYCQYESSSCLKFKYSFHFDLSKSYLNFKIKQLYTKFSTVIKASN